jgi:nucleotide-binding universal stress UspA family protein
MSKIICATRGGEPSYRTQDKAIALAKERGDTLIFLYVVDLHFLDKMAGSGIVDAEQEMTKMGEFLLLMAKERAAAQGIEAQTISRTGEVREEVQKAACEEGASLIVMGQPGDGDGESVFQLVDLETCAAEIESETGVETRIV